MSKWNQEQNTEGITYLKGPYKFQTVIYNLPIMQSGACILKEKNALIELEISPARVAPFIERPPVY